MKKFLFALIITSLILTTGCGNSENKTLNFKDINLEMVECPAGSFNMGSPLEEHSSMKNVFDKAYKARFGFVYSEKLHLVKLTKPFYIGKFEVTQSQYEKIMGKNPSKRKGPDKPVENVTWKEAKAFCDKINTLYKDSIPQGYKFDLPTEAQWEYACRAGTNTALNNGKNIESIDEVGWHNKNASETKEVGLKKPNAWGIFDMHGNIQEWCRDNFEDLSDKEAIDPEIISSKDELHIVRGGSMLHPADICRSATRACFPLNSKGEYLGFRVALVAVK